MFRDGSGLEQFNQMLSNPKVVELAKKMKQLIQRIKKILLTEVAIQKFLMFNKKTGL
jgi:hypothetical protein